jgi:hypothetical protein
MVLQCLGPSGEEIEDYGRALALQADWHQAAENRGQMRLLAGEALGGGFMISGAGPRPLRQTSG